MSLRRAWEVFRLDLRHHFKRPLFWILILIVALIAWMMSTGHMRISSGDSDTGGQKAWISSEFGNARVLGLLAAVFFSFFVAVGAGMVVIRDEETKVTEVLHATPLRIGEYVWGKFLAVFCAFLLVFLLQLGFHAFSNHVLASAKSGEYVGPFEVWNYLGPSIVFVLPTILFFAGTTFAIGARWRRPIPVFFLPVAVLLASIFFLWDWSPTWLDPRINRALMLIDPSGVRWLSETWLKVDRGVEFYNHASVPYEASFLASRVGYALLGLVAVWLTQIHLSATLRAKPSSSRGRRDAPASIPGLVPLEALEAPPPVRLPSRRPLAALAMRNRRPGFVRATLEIARVELQELRASAGFYLFVPLILAQTAGTAALALGAFDTPLLLTSGLLAWKSMNTLTFLVCLLLFFYTTESLERERARGLAPIHSSTPVATISILLGKALANSLIGIIVLAAAFCANVSVLAVQGQVGLELRPFLLIWGLLLVPTFLFWCSFVTAVYSLTGNRFATYGVCLGALYMTGYVQMRGWMTWVGNWNLWNAIQWSDLGTFELLRNELWLNRLLVLSAGAAFLALSVRLFPRRAPDAAATLVRLSPGRFLRTTARFSPWLAAPLVLGIWLEHGVSTGFQGDDAKKAAKDYWAKNVETWKDAENPSIKAVDVDLEFEPAERWFRSNGTFTLINDYDHPLTRFALTRGFRWRNLEWTIDGEKAAPEDRAGLCVFAPAAPLAPGAELRLGFRHEGNFPEAATKNGGGASEFILPSGIVLTSFGPSIVPVLGFMHDVGVDEDNHTDAKIYPDNFYEGITRSGFGNNTPCTTHVRITAPAAYTINSVGTLVSDETSEGRRTVVWESDHPVSFFNVVAGKWDVRRGEGTAIFYHPSHGYNVDEMLQALDGARKWYSEWFRPYPWKELKLSEFPGLAGYAQGFPTNITFSENLGFLTKSEPKAEAPFMVTAHEAAHQWWGNILVPGKGPGGDLLSEGMSHFSTVLLMDQVKGVHERIEFLRQLETRYGDRRQVDSEKPLVKLDGSREGDETVLYDKGGWVFWMLLNRMGRDQNLAGLRQFIRKYEENPDHPVLQDFVATMRELALDKPSYDEFVKQWFFEVVLPEYRLEDPVKTRIVGVRPVDDGMGSSEAWEVRVQVKNVGTGRMPVEIAAARGERFPDEDAADEEKSVKPPEAAPGTVQASGPSEETAKAEAEPYRDARATVTLGAGESQEVLIRCGFEPDRVLVDPDALVLQLQRKLAVHRF